MTNRWVSVAVSALACGVAGVGCVSADDDGEGPESTSPPAVEIPGEGSTNTPTQSGGGALGFLEARYSRASNKLAFEWKVPSKAGVSPQGYDSIPDGNWDHPNPAFELTTTNIIAVNSACGPADPANGYYTSPQPLPGVPGNCPDQTLCAAVRLRNNASRQFDSLYLEHTSVSPAGFIGRNSAPVPTGYPLDNSLGLFGWGNLAPGNARTIQIRLALPSCADFTYAASLKGIQHRDRYEGAAATLTPGAGLDACTLPGHTTILQNAAPGTVESGIALPFPFTLFDYTLDSDLSPDLSISSNGTLGLTEITYDNLQLPEPDYLADYTIAAFWDELNTSAQGVCYAVTGAAPERQFVVTWKNADIASTPDQENMTFSAVLHEGSDDIDLQYLRWSRTQANCSAYGPSRGAGASAGVQWADVGNGVVGESAGYNSTFLPTRPAACPSNHAVISLQALDFNGIY